MGIFSGNNVWNCYWGVNLLMVEFIRKIYKDKIFYHGDRLGPILATLQIITGTIALSFTIGLIIGLFIYNWIITLFLVSFITFFVLWGTSL